VAGVAVHWYGNLIAPPSLLTGIFSNLIIGLYLVASDFILSIGSLHFKDTHNLYPDRFILATEACEGKFNYF
jgi:hypothetical protein